MTIHFRQLDLFRSVDPIVGLHVRLERAIDQHQPCHDNIGEICAGCGPHTYALRCATCGRFRCWLPKTVTSFVAEVIRVCGTPDEPLMWRHAAPSPFAAPAAATRSDHRRESDRAHTSATTESIMLMRKYAGSTFIRLEEVRDKPLQGKITDVGIGEYDRPVITFDDGSQLTLNATNTKTLCRELGPDSRDWIDAVVECYAGKTTYQNEPTDSVLVRVVSAPERTARTPPAQMDNPPEFKDF
jgi:hypothetical protein